MIDISGNRITMTRGDTLLVKLNITGSDGEPYVPILSDVIRFAMKQKYNDDDCLIKKIIPNDTLILRLESEDTKPLIQGKEYVYDIELTKADGIVNTFVSGKLMLTNEVD